MKLFKGRKYPIIVIFTGFCYTAAIYWLLLLMKSPLITSWAFWFPGAFIIGLISVWCFKIEVLRSIIFTVMGSTMGVILGIFADGLFDPSRNNLAGIEVVIIDFFVLIPTFLGGVLGLYIQKKPEAKN